MHAIQFKIFVAFLSFVLSASICSSQQIGTETPTNPRNSWVPLRSSIAQDSLWFGSAVSATPDTIVVGAWRYTYQNQTEAGIAMVYAKPANGWVRSMETAKLRASHPKSYDYCGISVAVSGDTVVVGCRGGGVVYVFQKPKNGWADLHEIATLTTSDGVSGTDFGATVAISADTVAVGAPAASVGGIPSAGKVYLYVKPSSGWTDMTETAQLTNTNPQYNDDLATGLAIQGDVVIAGAIHQYGTSSGSASVFVKPAAGWTSMTETAKLKPSDGTTQTDWFGYSVSIDVDTIAIGAPLARAPGGSVYVFTKPSSGWADATETAELRKPGSDNLGWALGVSGDHVYVADWGSFAVIDIYVEPVTGWVSTSRADESLFWTTGFPDGFGDAMVAVGNTLVVGAPFAREGYHLDQGEVEVLNNVP